MNLTLIRSLAAAAVLFSVAAFAQTSGASPSSGSALPPAPSAASDPSPALGANASAVKIGAINVEQAIFGSNEGQRDLDALSKKFEPKSNELKSQNDEIDSLKKQLTTQGDKLNDEAKANLQRQDKADDSPSHQAAHNHAAEIKFRKYCSEGREQIAALISVERRVGILISYCSGKSLLT